MSGVCYLCTQAQALEFPLGHFATLAYHVRYADGFAVVGVEPEVD